MPAVYVVSATEAMPDPVSLKRDDQTIMWRLGSGVRWGTAAPIPIRFLPAGGTSPGGVPYSEWPGSTPAPIDTTDTPPDRRPYWASANKPMPFNEKEWYHYEFDVEVFSTEAGWVAQTIRQILRTDGVWHDPDVENDPRP